jgi:hypothetical protein
MPRKPEPTFKLKEIIWDLAATLGTDNISAICRELDYKLEELRKKEELFEDMPDIRTVGRIVELDINRILPEVVVSKLPPHVWHLRNDYEDIKQLAESAKARQQAQTETEIEQEPYKETPHKQTMRELAKALAERFSLPSNWDGDLCRDLPIEFLPGEYALSLGNVVIEEDRRITVTYYDITAGVAEAHLVKGLYSHLSTSGLSKYIELVNEGGKFEIWMKGVTQYSKALLGFLKLIADDIKENKAGINYRDEAKSGLTRWFLLTIWNDVIQKAGGHSWITDSWYHPPEIIPETHLLQLKCGSFGIGIAGNKETLEIYENWHKELRIKYSEHHSAIDIRDGRLELSKLDEEIRKRLLEFSDMEHLPGHCELC